MVQTFQTSSGKAIETFEQDCNHEEQPYAVSCSDEPCLKKDGDPNRSTDAHRSHRTLCQLLAKGPANINGSSTLSDLPPVKVEKFFLEENNNITYDVEGVVKCPGNENSEEKRMNANSHGHNRNSSRSTNGSAISSAEGLTWTSDVAASQGHGPPRQPPEGMLSGRPSSQVQESSSHSSAMLASAGSPGNLSGIFRTPATLTDSSPRHLSTGSQFSTLYSSTGGGGGGSSPLSPYSNLHSAHPAAVVAAQGTHMQAPYSAFYPQFAASHGFPHRSMLAAHYPHIESYSAVLQSMGSQVQHASQTQLPRNTYLASQIPQYSILGTSHQRSHSVTSPGPSSVGPRHSPAVSVGSHNPGDSAARDLKSPIKYESVRDREHEGAREFHYKEDRSQSLSSIEFSGGKSVSFKDLPPRHESVSCKDDYKVPSGKEGSRKHRILTRPSDSVIESSSVDVHSGSYSSNRSSDQPSPKRSKPGYGSSLPASIPLHRQQGTGAEHGVPDNGSGPPQSSNLHYPPHFMKGSIIQLANGELKRVEDLQTEDFIQSADISSDLKIDSSTVVRMEENSDRSTVVLGFVVGEHRVQVTVEATVEHPFFVFGQGWSSCDPNKTAGRYGLDCHRLSVGDVCISLTHKEVRARALELSQQQLRHQENRNIQQSRSPTLTFQAPRSVAKCSESGQGQMCDNVLLDNLDKKSPRNSPMETATEGNQDQHQVDSRPPRKRHWSSSDHNNDSVHNDQKKQEKS